MDLYTTARATQHKQTSSVPTKISSYKKDTSTSSIVEIWINIPFLRMTIRCVPAILTPLTDFIRKLQLFNLDE